MSTSHLELFDPDVLLVFIGHSNDANDEAMKIRDLEREMARDWENLQRVANGGLPFKTVRVWEWNYDAPPLPGGQDVTITPSLDRANVALFVFKERVGAVTWTELERSRSRRSPSIPVVAFFPANPPDSGRMNDLTVAEAWTELLRKERVLTADWVAPDSKSLRPIGKYENGKHLQEIVLAQMKHAFIEVLRSLPTRADPEPATPTKTFLGDRPDLSHDRWPVLGHSVDDLESNAVRSLLEQPLARDQLRKMGLGDAVAMPPERLKALGCLTDGQPALATFLCLAPAVLLVDKVDGCGLQMVVYDHTRKAESSPSISVAKGNLLTLFEDGMSWLRTGATLRRLGHIGTANRDELEIPEIVLREALANALVHRDYETPIVREQRTRLEVFPDRVEITSFGNLLKPFLADQLNRDTDDRKPWRRNPLIADIFQYMGYVELNASGVSRMRLEMEKASLAFPRFTADPDESIVRVVLARPVGRADDNMADGSLSPRPGQLRAMISSTVADLPEHQRLAIDVCIRRGFFPLFIEEQQGPSEEQSLRMLDSADIYIGIYGWRYGVIPEGSTVSIAEIEFDHALKLGIPILAFTMHEDHPVTRAMVESGEIPQQKLTEFKNRVRETLIAGEFKSAEDLRGLLAQALAAVQVKAREATASLPKGATEIAPRRLFQSLPGTDLLIGREKELMALDQAWDGGDRKNVVAVVSWGGAGKTSLVAHWAARMIARPDRGEIERYFDWSFYSQGTNDRVASGDMFLMAALEFFGDEKLAHTSARAWEKGERLAQLVAQHRTLLILDGIEPLQDARSGELRDESIRALLRGLAARNPGLCLITTRKHVPELFPWHTTTAAEWNLARLPSAAGAALLTKLGVQGTSVELEQLADDVKGHALTLTLMGKYLVEAHNGDVRKRDVVSLAEADYEETAGHASRVIQAYESWLKMGDRDVELSILRLLGLFDRPAYPDVLDALRRLPVIAGLTDTLAASSDGKWSVAVKRLVQLGLVEEQRWEPRPVFGYSREIATEAMDAGKSYRDFHLGEPEPFEKRAITVSGLRTLNAHPLIREHFATRLRESAPEAWRRAHGRLFEHLVDSVPYWPEGLEGLRPLYQAVAHGCEAGRYGEALDVFVSRILRGTLGPHAYYSRTKLGAPGADLAAMSVFFVEPWRRLQPDLLEPDRAFLLNNTAYTLRVLGRLTEAREVMRAAAEMHVGPQDWTLAALTAGNLTELDLMLGSLPEAVRESKQSVAFADRTGVNFERSVQRTVAARTLHEAGRVAEARALFEEAAELIQGETQPLYPLLYSAHGFWLCDLLLSEVEGASWRTFLGDTSPKLSELKTCNLVEQRATTTLDWYSRSGWLVETALDHLTLGRVALYRAILGPSYPDFAESASHVDKTVSDLRRTNAQDHLPRALLTRAWLCAARGDNEHARADLKEAQFLAERGPMALHLADVHLYRARLLYRDDPETAREDLKRARAMIEDHGYLRRLPELEDAERIVFG